MQDEIFTLFRVQKTVFQMMRDRGYTVSEQNMNQKYEEFKKNYNGERQTLNMLV